MTHRRLPDYLLERLALGELSEKAAREAHEQLAREPEGAKRLEALRASNQALLARHRPEVVAKEIARRERAVAVQVRRPRLAWIAAPAGVLVAVLLLVLLRPEPEPETSIKGDAALLVYRQLGEKVELLPNGAQARAGDKLQLAYSRARKAYGVIISLDGAGKVTLHLPEHDGEAAPLVRDARTQLPHSYELDAAPGFERFFLVSSDTPFPTSLAVDAAHKLATRGDLSRTESLSLPKELEQTSFLMNKPSQ